MIRAYVPALDLVRQAHEHISSPARIVQPLVINGPVGCGKSALIAYLYSFYKQMNTSQLVVAHFVSASDKSVQSYELARRVIIAIKNHYQVQQEVPQDKDELVKELPSWLLIAESRGGMVLFLDGLDQLSNTDGSIVRPFCFCSLFLRYPTDYFILIT
jgi:Ni2+-binding GTPase involved in maturation of urease and hydrogenase